MAIENNDVKKDDSIDLSNMIRMSGGFKEKNAEKEIEAGVSLDTQKSPIELAEEAAYKHDTGIVVEKEEESNEPLRSTFDSDERREDFKKKTEEMDSNIEKTKRVVQVRPVKDKVEAAKLMDEIEATVILDDGTAVVPEGAQFIVPKTPEIEKEMEKIKKDGENGEVVEETNDSEVDAKTIAEQAKGALVKVIIDKTGLGVAKVDFTEDEREILSTANEIHLVEVENKEIETAEFERPAENGSFLQMIDQYQLSTSKAPMIFPGSGFKADMEGLPWGDFAAITLDTSEDSDDYLNFDKLYRKFSVVYNYMKNISIGPFKDFEDFLKHFAFSDMSLAVYGLLIATQPEEDSLNLRCNAKKCQQAFTYKYVPRTIIDFSTASKNMLEDIDKVADAKPEDRKKIWKEARVNKFKLFKIPNSNIIFELGLASCWDYLYGMISLINDYQRQELPDDDPKWELATMLMGLRAIRLPKRNGGYDRFSDPVDLVEVLLHLSTEEVAVIRAAYDQYVNQYYTSFKLRNIVCPHCGYETKEIPITPDELVFQIFQRQRNTGWQFDNFHDF